METDSAQQRQVWMARDQEVTSGGGKFLDLKTILIALRSYKRIFSIFGKKEEDKRTTIQNEDCNLDTTFSNHLEAGFCCFVFSECENPVTGSGTQSYCRLYFLLTLQPWDECSLHECGILRGNNFCKECMEWEIKTASRDWFRLKDALTKANAQVLFRPIFKAKPLKVLFKWMRKLIDGLAKSGYKGTANCVRSADDTVLV